MKSLSLFALPLLVNAATIGYPLSHEKRQMDRLSMLLGGSFMKPISQTKVTPEFNPSAVRESLVWGPFKLKAANSSHVAGGLGIKLDPNSDTLTGLLSGICQGCIIHSAKIDPSDKDGKRMHTSEGIYVHHIITADVGRSQLPNPVRMNCSTNSNPGVPTGGLPRFLGGGIFAPQGAPNSGSPSPAAGLIPAISVFVGKGNEADAVAFSAPGNSSKVKSGFYISKTDKILFTAELINYYKQDRDIYIHLDYEFTPNVANKPADVMDVGMGAISVDSCVLVKALYPPKDKPVTYKSPEWPVTQNGYLMKITPHLHDGGVNVKVYRNGEQVCTSNATYGSAVNDGQSPTANEKYETITSYTSCPDPIRIRKGDKLVMSSEYDLTKHKLRPSSHDGHGGSGGMAGGMAGGMTGGMTGGMIGGKSMTAEFEPESMALATFMWAKASDQSQDWNG